MCVIIIGYTMNEFPPYNTERELQSRHLLVRSAVHGYNVYNDAYKAEWKRLTNSDAPELTYSLIDVIQQRGSIPFHMFMAHVLYGKDGYYSSGRARPNDGHFGTPSGDFISIYSLLSHGYKELSDWPTTMAILGSGRGHFEHHTIRSETVNTGLYPFPEPTLFSVDYSHELLKTHTYPETIEQFKYFTRPRDERSPIHKVSASVMQLPFSANSLDIIQSVELFDSLPPVCFLVGKFGTVLQPHVTYQDGAFKIVYTPMDQSLKPLLTLKQTYIRKHNQTPPEIGRYQLITCNMNAVHVLSEISRVLRPGGVTAITDYVDENPEGNFLDYPYFAAYNKKGKLAWDQYVFESIYKYTFPYQDMSVQTEPLFFAWIGQVYGLELASLQSLYSLKQKYYDLSGNESDKSFMVTTLRKR